MSQRIRLTRKQLYELVWQKSISRLVAEDFGISGVGLAKLCARHGIPTPPRGYWAQLEAGRAPSRPKLPAGNDAQVIDLPGPRSPESTPDAHDELADEVAEEKDPANRINVGDRLHSPCALVEEVKRVLQDAKTDGGILLRSPAECLAVCVSKETLPRALRIADALIKALLARGWEVDAVGGFTREDMAGARIRFSIEEGLSTEQREKPPDLAGSYTFHYKRQESVRKPSGRLTLALAEEPRLWDQARRKWHDSERRSLDVQLNEVAVGMLRIATAVRAKIAEQEKARRREEERQRQLQVALDEQKKLRAEVAAEKTRVDNLRKQAERWREAANIRQFVDQVRALGAVPPLGLEGEDLEHWAEWARQQADRIDPLTPNPPSILDDADRIEHMCDALQGRR